MIMMMMAMAAKVKGQGILSSFVIYLFWMWIRSWFMAFRDFNSLNHLYPQCQTIEHCAQNSGWQTAAILWHAHVRMCECVYDILLRRRISVSWVLDLVTFDDWLRITVTYLCCAVCAAIPIQMPSNFSPVAFCRWLNSRPPNTTPARQPSGELLILRSKFSQRKWKIENFQIQPKPATVCAWGCGYCRVWIFFFIDSVLRDKHKHSLFLSRPQIPLQSIVIEGVAIIWALNHNRLLLILPFAPKFDLKKQTLFVRFLFARETFSLFVVPHLMPKHSHTITVRSAQY